MTFFDDHTTRGVSYQPTRGDYFIFSKNTSGDENYQNYRYDFATGQITLLTDGKSKNGPALVEGRRPDRLQLHPTRWQDVDLYVADVYTFHDGTRFRCVLSPAGKRRCVGSESMTPARHRYGGRV
jgi:hypothetical protein